MKLYQDNHAKEIILSRVTPEMVIERYTGQRSRHGKYVCPFHNDHDPSLSVKGSHWRCWVCDPDGKGNEHGNAIDFTMRFHGIGYAEALHKLNDDYALGIDFKGKPVIDPLEKLWILVAEEVRNHNKAECERHSAEINNEINELITNRRILMQHGASKSELAKYDAEIDSLQEYESALDGKPAPYRIRMSHDEIMALADAEEEERIKRRAKNQELI